MSDRRYEKYLSTITLYCLLRYESKLLQGAKNSTGCRFSKMMNAGARGPFRVVKKNNPKRSKHVETVADDVEDYFE